MYVRVCLSVCPQSGLKHELSKFTIFNACMMPEAMARNRPRTFGSRVVSVLDTGAEGPGFTAIVPLFTKQRNW